MNRHEIIEKLKNSSEEIRAFGVDKLFVFGSVLRDDFNDESDVDLLVDFLPEQKDFMNFTNLYLFVEENFKRDVDLLTRKSINTKMEMRIFSTMQQVV
jgi:uncharacterized protein